MSCGIYRTISMATEQFFIKDTVALLEHQLQDLAISRTTSTFLFGFRFAAVLTFDLTPVMLPRHKWVMM